MEMPQSLEDFTAAELFKQCCDDRDHDHVLWWLQSERLNDRLNRVEKAMLDERPGTDELRWLIGEWLKIKMAIVVHNDNRPPS